MYKEAATASALLHSTPTASPTNSSSPASRKLALAMRTVTRALEWCRAAGELFVVQFGTSGADSLYFDSIHDTVKQTSFGASPVNTPQAQYGYQQQSYQEQEHPHHPQHRHQQQQQPQLRHHSNSGDSVASTSSAPYPHVSAPADSHSSSLYVPYGSSNPNQSGPIYAPYGSSVISVNPPSNSSYKPPPLSITLPPSAPGPNEFDPSRLGLPAPPPNGMTNNFAGLYSSSGFDMLGVLARVAARPNPQLSIGAVDTSCAFLVVDAKRWDQPIVFASETFSKMTGYASEEIIGRNCEFSAFSVSVRGWGWG